MEENKKRTEEYKEYYATRAKRYEGKDNWQNSYASEKKLSDYMQSLNSIDDGNKDEVVGMTFEIAKSINKDQYLMELKHFEKEQEVVRAAGTKRLLESIDKQTNINDLAMIVQEELNKIDIEDTSDKAHRDCFQECIRYILQYEREMLWEGPSKYKPENPKGKLTKKINEKLQMIRNNVIKYDPNWKLEPERNVEHRHIRKIAYYKFEHIQEFFGLFLEVINK